MKKIIRLNEQDIEKLVRKIIAESKTDAVVRYTEPELIMNITNLLVNELGYDPKRLPKDLDALDEILWEESQDYEDNIPDDVMADIQHLLSQIGLIKGHYNQTEDDYMSDFSEQRLIEKTYDLLEVLGVEERYIQDLEEAAEILENESHFPNSHGPILNKEIQNLLTEIYVIIGFPGEDEYDEYEDEY